ncbi:MAG: tetratricopeptide repeat protein [Zoogloeaceae bacterium]|jgi:tetratricopeptide (TPR) repeat protein|nr:tetratricopeptide repeat protein [Zoogloeaceae bacterium]
MSWSSPPPEKRPSPGSDSNANIPTACGIRCALAIWEKAFGTERPDVAISPNNLALFYHAQGDYVDAEPPYSLSLAIWEKTLCPDRPNVATNLEDLATMYRKSGRDAEAEALKVCAARIHAIEQWRGRQPVADAALNSNARFMTKADSGASHGRSERLSRF